MRQLKYRVVREDLDQGFPISRAVVGVHRGPVLEPDLYKDTEYERFKLVRCEARTVSEVIADRLFWGDHFSLAHGRSLYCSSTLQGWWEWKLWTGTSTVNLPRDGAARLIAGELHSSGVRVTTEEVRDALVNFVDEWPPHEDPPHPELVEDFGVGDVLEEGITA